MQKIKLEEKQHGHDEMTSGPTRNNVLPPCGKLPSVLGLSLPKGTCQVSPKDNRQFRASEGSGLISVYVKKRLLARRRRRIEGQSRLVNSELGQFTMLLESWILVGVVRAVSFSSNGKQYLGAYCKHT